VSTVPGSPINTSSTLSAPGALSVVKSRNGNGANGGHGTNSDRVEAGAAERYRITGKQTLTDQVVERLTTLIVNGELAPGTMLLPEKDLALEFGVSRIVIREAIRILAAQGLVGVRHGVGTCVNAPQDWRVAEPLALLLRATDQSLLRWLELRIMLEVGAAPIAAERATQDDLRELRAALETMQVQAEGGMADSSAFVEADLRFHLGVAAAAQNALLVCVLRPVLAPLEDQLRQVVEMPSAPAQAVAEHRDIFDCIAAGDAAGARAAMEAHLGRVASEIDSVMHGERR
jgi:GntR family transcriptional regulator, transcriptional repressor for pyruvate dehydrogenase complex